MFEKLTYEGTRVITCAENETRRTGHSLIGTEQILVGLVGEGSGIAACVLASFGLYLRDVRAAAKSLRSGDSEFQSRNMGYTTRAQTALAQSEKEAYLLESKTISSEHILLGLLHEERCLAITVLQSFGIDPENLRMRVYQTLHGLKFPAAVKPKLRPTELAQDDLDDCWDWDCSPSSMEDAVLDLCGLDSFIAANGDAVEVLERFQMEKSILGIYVNAKDDYLLICENKISWHHGESVTSVDYESIESVEMPNGESDCNLRVILKTDETLILLPVQNQTSDKSDLAALRNFVEFCTDPANANEIRLDIQDIESLEDLISYLRQPDVYSQGFDGLIKWFERGGPKPSWLGPLNIRKDLLYDPSVLRVLALILSRCPETQLKTH